MIIRLILLLVIGVLFSTVDGFGQNTWLKTFGGSGLEFVNSITTTTDGGCVLTGYTSSTDGDFSNYNTTNQNPFVAKLDFNGDVDWILVPNFSRIFSITNTNSGGYVYCGVGNNSLNIKKTNSKGNIELWSYFLNSSSGIVRDVSMIRNDKDEYIISFHSKSNDGVFEGLNMGGYDIIVLKLNTNGILQWIRNYGGSSDDRIGSITMTEDGCYFLNGYTYSNDGDFLKRNDESTFLIKLDSNGNLIKTTYLNLSKYDGGYSITSTSDSGCIFSSSVSSIQRERADILITKVNSNGEIRWTKVFGGSNDEYGIGRYSIREVEGEYIFTGLTSSNDGDFMGMNKGGSDIFVMKINIKGDLVWKKTFGGRGDEIGNSITTIQNGNILLTGTSTSNDGDFLGLNKMEKEGNQDIFVMKLDSNGNLNNTTSINEYSEPTTTLSVHPNPISNYTTVSYRVNTPSNIRIELLNTLGQTIEVLREDYSDIGTYQLPLNISTLSSGMYSVRMISGSMNEVVPVCVVR